MDRRTFVRGAATGVVGLAAGGAAGAAKVHHDVDTSPIPEQRAFARMGDGSVRVVWSVDTAERAVALTFDDGPHPDLTPAVLDLLAERGVQATFFLIGQSARARPDLVARIVLEGHEVANHTDRHSTVVHLDGDQTRADVVDGAGSLEAVTGTVPRWFRAPRGMLNGAILRAAADLGHDVAMWSARVPILDGHATAAERADRLMVDVAPGAIVLLHDGTSGREDDALEARRRDELPVLAAALDRLAADGYRCVTLSELAALADPSEP